MLPGCKTTEEDALKKNPCRNFLIIPPHSEDERTSDYVAARWINAIRKNLGRCDKITSYSLSKKSLALINIDHTTVFDFKKLDEKKLDVAAEKTKSTDVVFLNFKLTERLVSITPVIYDIKDLKKPKKNDFGPSALRMNPADLRRLQSKGFSALFANLIPNAATLSASNKGLSNSLEGEKKVREISSTEKSYFPKIISGIGFTNISHPAGFNMFDYETRTFGSLAFYAIDHEYKYERLDEKGDTIGDPVDYRVKFYFAGPLVNSGISFYWPLGTTFMSVGIGPGVYTLRDSEHASRTDLVVSTTLDLGHRVFLSEKLFFQLSGSFLWTTGKPLIKNTIFKSGSTSTGSFGIGYFLPEMRSALRTNL